MIKIENVEVVGWEHAIRGMRNPMNSWDKSDSINCDTTDCAECPYDAYCGNNKYAGFRVGENDFELMKKLVKAGTDHRKFMRMIVVYADVTAPLYWWKEADTYKVGTVRNSCSTMHKITEKEFTLDDFSHEHLVSDEIDCLIDIINNLNDAREIYLNYENVKDNISKDINSKKDVWWQIIQILPSSYNQKATLMLNYEVLANMYHSRKNHRLDEWREFCKWIETLPYSELITMEV